MHKPARDMMYSSVNSIFGDVIQHMHMYFRALAYSHKTNASRKRILKSTINEHPSVSDVDFDLLVTRVEDTILEDEHRRHAGMTPQELMLRSNPALFSSETTASRDLTNPREMYTILSHKSKSIEDLAAKFKQELVKSVQCSGSLPKLSRAVSMNDIDRRIEKRHKPSDITHRQLNMLLLNRQKSSLIEDFHKVSDTEIVRTFNLPHIGQQTSSRMESENVRTRHKAEPSELPTLVQTETNTNRNIEVPHMKAGDQAHEQSHEEKHISFSDTKLEKWFSEMPNEEFDRAQRALMEESIQDKLKDYKRKRSRKMNFPNQNFNICIGSKMRKVPNTYLEFRVDSFGRHLQNDKDDKMNRYRLQQKSMHNLKMRESTDADTHEKLHREETLPKLSLQNRSLTNLGLSKQKHKSDNDICTTKTKKDAVNIQTDGGFKTLYINDRLGLDLGSGSKQKLGISNYEDYTERMVLNKDVHDHGYFKESPPISYLEDSAHCIADTGLERDHTKAAIVNLSLNKEIPNVRKLLHIATSMKEAKANKCVIMDEPNREDTIVNQSEDIEANTEQIEPNIKQAPDHIITKIPTAQSMRTESKSSNSSINSRGNKEAMKKFNTLEVFAESHRHAAEYTFYRDNTIPENAIRPLGGPHGTPFPSSLKLDLKHPQRHIPLQMISTVALNEIKRPEIDVVFRFEPGEVFVASKHRKETFKNNRSSKRARIIYGKVVHGQIDKKDVAAKPLNEQIDVKDRHSAGTVSTKLPEGYRSELCRFESRALDGSLRSISPRQDDGADNHMLVVMSNPTQQTVTRKTHIKTNQSNDVVTKHDVATETDMICSPTAFHSDVMRDNPKQSAHNSLGIRSGSGLSDFIFDDNDGESLESDSDKEGDISTNMRQRSSHSV